MLNSYERSQSPPPAVKAPPPGTVPQPDSDGLPFETVPDWNNIGLFAAGIAVGAVLGAAVALLMAPATGEMTRHSISRRVRRLRGDDEVWDELAEELERAASSRKEKAAEAAVDS
ncbi:MAG TPA: YtxH domain-containing protein [Gemmatimonadaceae bacterium]|nr:YtxH domain-containing protein [Gemmatimonadaceae bacterium]